MNERFASRLFKKVPVKSLEKNFYIILSMHKKGLYINYIVR